MRRRETLTAAAFAVLGAGTARGQAWPARAIRLIVPWPPGQATDLAGRVVGQKVAESLGQSVVVENRAGAGGMIGTDAAAKSAPDGYTLLAASSGPVTINPLVQRTPFDPERDLTPVAQTVRSPYLLIVRPGFPATDAASFVAAVRAAPGRYAYATSGAGATAHLITEAMNSRAQLQGLHVPFAGSGPAMAAIAAGNVDFAIDTLAATLPLVRGGNVRALAITTAATSPLAPGVPPLADAAGLPGFDLSAWIGIMAPGGTPAPIVARLAAAIEAAVAAPDVRERLSALGVDPEFHGPEAFATLLREQRAMFGQIVRATGIRAD